MKKEADEHAARDVQRLRQLATFENFSDRDLERLVRAADHRSHPKPWPLIREQTPSNDCFILLSGEAGVYVGDDQVAVVGPGEVIGESALRQGKLRSATVTTLGPAEVLRIERDDLTRLLDEIPALRVAIDTVVAQHIPTGAPAPAMQSAPERAKVNASVPAELAARFEKAAGASGVTVSAALEDALTGWIERRGEA